MEIVYTLSITFSVEAFVTICGHDQRFSILILPLKLRISMEMLIGGSERRTSAPAGQLLRLLLVFGVGAPKATPPISTVPSSSVPSS